MIITTEKLIPQDRAENTGVPESYYWDVHDTTMNLLLTYLTETRCRPDKGMFLDTLWRFKKHKDMWEDIKENTSPMMQELAYYYDKHPNASGAELFRKMETFEPRTLMYVIMDVIVLLTIGD